MFLLFACAEPPPPSLAPDTHTWKDEGQLVVDGIEEVQRLYKAGNKDAAQVLAERVYTDRWEPRLEQAARRIPDGKPVIEIEYAWSRLFVELDGPGRNLEEQAHDLEETVRNVADAAGRAFPPPAESGLPAPPPAASEGSHPIVPDVPPNWERPAEGGEE
jgi:hypothetical protein